MSHNTTTSSEPEPKSKIKVTSRHNRSSSVYLLHRVTTLFKSQLIKLGEPLPAGSPHLQAHKSATKTCDVKERVVEDTYVYDILPKQAAVQNGATKPRKKRRLFYFAGGGWQMVPSSQHWKFCAELARELPDISISVVSYPLAPNSPAPSSFPQIMRLYKRLLEEAEEAGESIILAGDSAGGHIVLCIALAALREDDAGLVPDAILAISPSCDLRRSNPDIQEMIKVDPILKEPFIKETARMWRADWDPADPRVSPNMADVSALARRGVKVHGVTGGYDMLAPDALLFRSECEQAGIEGEWLHWEKQMHCFPLAWPYNLPESVEAKDWILDVLRRS